MNNEGSKLYEEFCETVIQWSGDMLGAPAQEKLRERFTQANDTSMTFRALFEVMARAQNRCPHCGSRRETT